MPQLPAEFSVRFCATEPLTLSGLQAIDEVAGFEADEILVPHQMGGIGNGVYRMSSDAWYRHENFSTDENFIPGQSIYIREGTEHGRTTWRFTNSSQPVLGSYALNYALIDDPTALTLHSGGGLELDDISGGIKLTEFQDVEGDYANPFQRVTAAGRISKINATAIGSSYRVGLEYESTTGQTIRLRPGAAYVPGLKKIVINSTAKDIALPTTTDGLWYLYFTEVNDEGHFYYDTVAPEVSAYVGTARTKAGDPNSRYIGMARNSGTALIPFETENLGEQGFLVQYQRGFENPAIAAFNNVGATTSNQNKLIGPTGAAASDRLLSPYARVLWLYVEKATAAPVLYLGWPTDAGFPPWEIPANTLGASSPPLRVSPAQQINWRASASVNFSAYVLAYIEKA